MLNTWILNRACTPMSRIPCLAAITMLGKHYNNGRNLDTKVPFWAMRNDSNLSQRSFCTMVSLHCLCDRGAICAIFPSGTVATKEQQWNDIGFAFMSHFLPHCGGSVGSLELSSLFWSHVTSSPSFPDGILHSIVSILDHVFSQICPQQCKTTGTVRQTSVTCKAFES